MTLLINSVRLLNCRADRLPVKLLPHNFELEPSDRTIRDFMLPLLVVQFTPLYEKRNVAEQPAPLTAASFCSHAELTVIKLRFSLSVSLTTLLNATGFSRTFSLSYVDFGSCKQNSVCCQEL